MKSEREILELWPSRSDLAADVGEKLDTVRKWIERGSIPKEKMQAVLEAARKRKIPLSAEILIELSAA